MNDFGLLDWLCSIVRAVAEVLTRPSVTDWLMVLLTAGSILVSAVLGFFAYWNGRQAMKIAADSAKRERKRLKRERARFEAEARNDLAVAASRAINAIHYNISRHPGSAEEHKRRVKELQNDLVLEAGSKLDVAVLDSGREDLSLWFRRTTNRLRAVGYAGGAKDPTYKSYREAVQKHLADWNAGLITPAELLATFEDAPPKPS